MTKCKTWTGSVKHETLLCTFLKSWREIFPVRSLSKVMNLCLICLQKSWIGLEILSMDSTHWLLSGPGLIWRTKSENAAWVYSQYIYIYIYIIIYLVYSSTILVYLEWQQAVIPVNSLVSWGAAVWVCGMQCWPEDWTSAQSAAGSPGKRDVHCFWCRIW